MAARTRLLATPLLVAAVLALAGCTPAGSPSGTAPSPTPTDAVPAFDHVVIVLEENKPAERILGSDEAPFLNSLAEKYAVARDYAAITNPSLPNYIALVSGTTAGITSDCGPDECTADVPSIADRLEASGRTWKIYAEGMPSPCAMESSGGYATKHVPFLYFPAIRDHAERCAASVVPYSQLEADLAANALPDLAVVIPDLCNDMHDCSIATGDTWLSKAVPAILDSPAFAGDSLLAVTFDEGTQDDNSVATILAGPAARRGASSDAPYSHYSLLHTIEKAWDLEPLTKNDAKAPVMADLLGTASRD
jgi:hypothetical protein